MCVCVVFFFPTDVRIFNMIQDVIHTQLIIDYTNHFNHFLFRKLFLSLARSLAFSHVYTCSRLVLIVFVSLIVRDFPFSFLWSVIVFSTLFHSWSLSTETLKERHNQLNNKLPEKMQRHNKIIRHVCISEARSACCSPLSCFCLMKIQTRFVLLRLLFCVVSIGTISFSSFLRFCPFIENLKISLCNEMKSKR